MSLSIALAQIQMRPQYHHSYEQGAVTDVKPVRSVLWMKRQEIIFNIVKKLGNAQMCKVMIELRKVDKTLHEDDARKMLSDLVKQDRLTKTSTHDGRRNVFYKARPA